MLRRTGYKYKFKFSKFFGGVLGFHSITISSRYDLASPIPPILISESSAADCLYKTVYGSVFQYPCLYKV